MALYLDPQKAFFWGGFIEIAAKMDAAGETNPSQPSYFKQNWTLVKNISMEVGVGAFKQREFIGFVAQSTIDRNRFAVVLHGNQGLLDFLQELDFFMTDFTIVPDGGKTEFGFTSIYESFLFIDPNNGSSQNLVDYLNGLSRSDSFTIAGFSLGAALGTMHALALAYRKIPVEAYLFASPMAGDKDFVNQYNSLVPKSYLIINKPDIVPQLPGTTLGYNHVKTRFQINSLDFPEIKHNIICNHLLEVYLYTLGDRNINLGSCKA